MADSVLRIIVLCIIPLLLAAGAVWYWQLLSSALFGRFPDTIDDFQIVGSETVSGNGKKSELQGKKYAAQLCVELARVQIELKDAFRAFKSQSRKEISLGVVGGKFGWTEAIPDLPSSLFQKIDLKMVIAGTEVGGIVNWLRQWIFSWQSMKIVYQNRNDGSVIVFGNLDTIGRESFFLDINNAKDEKVLEVIARSIAGYRMFKNLVEFDGLNDAQRAALVSSLIELGKSVDGTLKVEELPELLDTLDRLIQKIPRSPRLLRMAAVAAQKAGNKEKELEYLRKLDELLQKLAPKTSPFSVKVAQRIAVLTEEMKSQRRVVKRIAAVPKIQGAENSHTSLIANINGVVAEEFAPILKAIGVKDVNMERPVKVGLAGLAILKERSKAAEVHLGTESTGGRGSLGDYAEALMSITRNVAPKVKFVSGLPKGTQNEPVGGLTSALLAESVGKLTDEDKVDIILFTFSGVKDPSLGTVVEKSLEKAAESGVIVVRAAGNDGLSGGSFEKASRSLNSIVVGSIDSDGEIALSSNSFNGMVWAPGVSVPYIKQGSVDFMSGTSPASALAAGVAARLKSDFYKCKARDIVKEMKNASVKIHSDGPAVINYEATKKRLEKKATTQ